MYARDIPDNPVMNTSTFIRTPKAYGIFQHWTNYHNNYTLPSHMDHICYIDILVYLSSYIMPPFICGALKEASQWVLQEMGPFSWLSAVFSLKRPQPNPAICWLHPGEQKLIPTDDPQHPPPPPRSHCEQKMSDILILQQRCSFFFFFRSWISFKHDTLCEQYNKCSWIILAWKRFVFFGRKSKAGGENRVCVRRERAVWGVVGGGFNASKRCLIFQRHLFLVLRAGSLACVKHLPHAPSSQTPTARTSSPVSNNCTKWPAASVNY